jgi:hypothetical protein
MLYSGNQDSEPSRNESNHVDEIRVKTSKASLKHKDEWNVQRYEVEAKEGMRSRHVKASFFLLKDMSVNLNTILNDFDLR